uniref:CD63 antigen n=1 Tax=Monopterus albus TaxID=43700 RepID=UPI0009B42AF1|nr:CD63 antigen-like [Monopterus albus]
MYKFKLYKGAGVAAREVPGCGAPRWSHHTSPFSLCLGGKLCAIAAIVLGIVVKVGLQKTIPVTDSAGIIAPLILIAAGGLLFLVSLFGFRAVLKEDYAMLAMFVMLLVLIFLALIAVATAGFVFRNRVQSIVRYTINEMMSSYRFFTCKKNRLPMDLVQMKFAIFLVLAIIIDLAALIAGYVFRNEVSSVVDNSLAAMMSGYKNNTELRTAVDKLQQDVQCCGVNSTAYWTNYKPNKNSVPDSCCVNVTKDCGLNNMKNPVKVHQLGCQPAVEALLRKQIQWVIIAALVIAFLKVVGIVFACMLIRGIRSGYTVM